MRIIVCTPASDELSGWLWIDFEMVGQVISDGFLHELDLVCFEIFEDGKDERWVSDNLYMPGVGFADHLGCNIFYKTMCRKKMGTG